MKIKTTAKELQRALSLLSFLPGSRSRPSAEISDSLSIVADDFSIRLIRCSAAAYSETEIDGGLVSAGTVEVPFYRFDGAIAALTGELVIEHVAGRVSATAGKTKTTISSIAVFDPAQAYSKFQDSLPKTTLTIASESLPAALKKAGEFTHRDTVQGWMFDVVVLEIVGSTWALGTNRNCVFAAKISEGPTETTVIPYASCEQLIREKANSIEIVGAYARSSTSGSTTIFALRPDKPPASLSAMASQSRSENKFKANREELIAAIKSCATLGASDIRKVKISAFKSQIGIECRDETGTDVSHCEISGGHGAGVAKDHSFVIPSSQIISALANTEGDEIEIESDAHAIRCETPLTIFVICKVRTQ